MNTQELEQQLKESMIPVLVEFYADWCGPCHVMKPIIESLRIELGSKAEIITINADEEQEITNQYLVLSLPTFLIFKNGQLTERLVGAQIKEKLKEYLN